MPFTFSCDALNCRSSMYEYPKLLGVRYKWVRFITKFHNSLAQHIENCKCFSAIILRENRNVSIHVTYGPNIKYNYV